MTSWRTASVALLSFSSGLPLGLVWIAIPDWMRDSGVRLEVVGLFTLAHAPWTFKIVWAPLMDRFAPPWLGRRRGWMVAAQAALFASTLALAGVGQRPEAPWVVLALALAIAFASASQDIVIDAYAVEILRPAEQGVVVGARIAIYRAAMFVAGGAAITLAAQFSWPLVCVGLALCYLPMVGISIFAPEPDESIPAPASLREAVWLPFVELLRRRRALEILGFVVCYKLSDNLVLALMRPFLVDMGYDAFDRGVALATVGMLATLTGTFIGGAVTTTLGLGHSLWIFGVLQIASNFGYVLVAQSEINRPLMYGAMAFESLATGLGTGAFSVLLLRMTRKRFSATQYALFSSLFGLPRLIAGPITGVTVVAVGWTTFFWITIAAGIPGMLLLARFSPLGVRDPTFSEELPARRRRRPAASPGRRGIAGGLLGALGGAATVATLSALRAARDDPSHGFDWTRSAAAVLQPADAAGWIALAGIALTGVVCALLAAAWGTRQAGSD